MNKVTITLELTPQEVITVMNAISISPSAPHTTPSEPKLVKEVQSPAKPITVPVEAPKVPTATAKIGGKKGPTMPRFGRTQEQINAYVEAEASRVEALDEEAELKAQRKADKEASEEVKQAEVNAIKAAEITVPANNIARPWLKS